MPLDLRRDFKCRNLRFRALKLLSLINRPSEQAADVVRQAIEIGADAVWLQQGIVSADGRRLAEAAGIDYIEDHCIAVIRSVFQVRPPVSDR